MTVYFAIVGHLKKIYTHEEAKPVLVEDKWQNYLRWYKHI